MNEAQQAALDELLASLDVWTMAEVAPALTCIEAEALGGFLTAFGLADQAAALAEEHDAICSP